MKKQPIKEKTVSGVQIRLAYEHFYQKRMPMNLSYNKALEHMMKEFGFGPVGYWIQNCSDE